MNTLELEQGFQAKRHLLFEIWLLSTLFLVCAEVLIKGLSPTSVQMVYSGFVQALIPLGACIFLGLLSPYVPLSRYLLFFAISLTSAFGLTETLTGSHAASNQTLLYGLSFYTASLAFVLARQEKWQRHLLVMANPLLLITGPVATFCRVINYRAFAKRLDYFLPFFVFGLFLHQVIATPLTSAFFLIERTDAASSVVFALIFELFVYANFCGLSLIVYGLAGLMGLKIPLNFRQPFSATNLVEFWKGWHTSLSAVLKALFYAPTRKHLGTYGAIFCVYLASAMWHGITLNFLVWGLMHAVFFCVTLMLLKRRIPVFPTVLMVVGIVVGRMVFADADTDRLLQKLVFGFTDFSVLQALRDLAPATRNAFVLILLMVVAEFVFQRSALFKKRNYKFYRLPVVQLILLLAVLLSVKQGLGVDYAVYGQR
jgi:D-alanyl-lipoteichoic acid acyltransferase DltB (MBOAT superfamily)